MSLENLTKIGRLKPHSASKDDAATTWSVERRSQPCDPLTPALKPPRPVGRICTEPPKLPRWPFAFDPEKAIEAVLFVLPHIRQPTLHSVSKVLYQADRLHLARYGRPITGDHYVAMKHGPVPSATYDTLKTLRGDARTPVVLPKGAEDALAVENGYAVCARRDARSEFLSASERECLAEAVAVHGSKSFGELTEESHDAAWHAASENDVIELEHFLLTLDNCDELKAS